MSDDVGPAEEFPEGEMRIVEVNHRTIGVVRWNGALFAVRNGCPHQNAPLCKGAVRAPLRSVTVGTIDLQEGAPVITCPWHGWGFDLASGVSVTGDKGRVRAYEVREEGGRVLIEMSSARKSESAR